MAGAFREAGIPAEVYPEPRKIAAQFAYAEKRGIPLAVICGSDERAKGVVNLKDLRSPREPRRAHARGRDSQGFSDCFDHRQGVPRALALRKVGLRVPLRVVDVDEQAGRHAPAQERPLVADDRTSAAAAFPRVKGGRSSEAPRVKRSAARPAARRVAEHVRVDVEHHVPAAHHVQRHDLGGPPDARPAARAARCSAPRENGLPSMLPRSSASRKATATSRSSAPRARRDSRGSRCRSTAVPEPPSFARDGRAPRRGDPAPGRRSAGCRSGCRAERAARAGRPQRNTPTTLRHAAVVPRNRAVNGCTCTSAHGRRRDGPPARRRDGRGPRSPAPAGRGPPATAPAPRSRRPPERYGELVDDPPIGYARGAPGAGRGRTTTRRPRPRGGGPARPRARGRPSPSSGSPRPRGRAPRRRRRAPGPRGGTRSRTARAPGRAGSRASSSRSSARTARCA